jgi:hypothetical protein
LSKQKVLIAFIMGCFWIRNIYAFDDALQATLTDNSKFARLAARLGALSAEAKSELRKRLESGAGRVHDYRTRTLVTPSAWGPARMHAIGLIVNRMTSVEPGIPENWSTPLAPTKPPFLWNSPQGSWTQWRGTIQDPIQRNLTETMGVFMAMDLRSKTPADGLFDSNAALLTLEKIENALTRLAPPEWPEEVFGKIDLQKAAEGRAPGPAGCRVLALALDRSPAPDLLPLPQAFSLPPSLGKRP